MSLLRPEWNRPGTLDEWLREAFFGDDFFAPAWADRRLRGDRFSNLASDLYEDAEAFHAVMELPGVAKEAVTVELENAVLRVSGKHTDKAGESESTYEFSRALALPEGVEAGGITAEMKDGLLRLVLPKREERKPRQIEVN